MPQVRSQSGIIPYRRCDDGSVELLLITSSTDSTRWQFPKGMLEPGLSPLESAEQEAFEEAGALGMALPTPVATDRYTKSGVLPCEVVLYPMQVQRLLPPPEWEEHVLRDRRWATPAEAEALLSRPALRDALRAFMDWLAAATPPPTARPADG